MAKGDQKQEQKNISGMQNTFWNNYTSQTPNQLQTYNDLMGAYKNYAANPWGNPFGASSGSYAAPSGPVTSQGNLNPYDWVTQEANRLGRTDIAQNPQYWADVISQQGPNIDTGYWSGRMASANIPSAGGSGGFQGFSSPAYGGYQNFAGGGGSIGMDPEFRGGLSKALAGYGNFADTGGFSPQDIADIRARGISPVRAVYANAQNNIDRQRALQGGYSPNYTAATAKMSRELSNNIADAVQNTNAGIAQMVQQGKLAGLGGLSSTGAAGAGLQAQIDQFNKNLQLAGLGGMAGLDQFGAQLGLSYDQLAQAAKQFGLSGAQSLYSAKPGLSSLFGDQALEAARLGSANAQATPGFPWKDVIGGAGSVLSGIASMGKNPAASAMPGSVPTSSFIGPTLPVGTALSGTVPIASGIGTGGALAGGEVLPGAVTLPGMTSAAAGPSTSAASALSGGGGFSSALGPLAAVASPFIVKSLIDAFGTNQRPLDQYSIDQNTNAANDLFNTYGAPTEGYNPYSMYLLQNQVNPDLLQA